MNKSMFFEEWDLVKHENDNDVVEDSDQVCTSVTAVQNIDDDSKLNNGIKLSLPSVNNTCSKEKQNICVLNSEVLAMMTDFHDVQLDLKKKILELEEEKKSLNMKNKKLKTTVDEIENKLSFIFNHIKLKPDDNKKILNPSIWLQSDKLSDADKLKLEYMRHRNSIIRDRSNKEKNHFMPEFK